MRRPASEKPRQNRPRLGAGRCASKDGYTPLHRPAAPLDPAGIAKALEDPMADHHNRLKWYEGVPAVFVSVVWLTTVVGAWFGGDLRGWVVVVGYFAVVAGTLAAIAVIVIAVRAFRAR